MVYDTSLRMERSGRQGVVLGEYPLFSITKSLFVFHLFEGIIHWNYISRLVDVLVWLLRVARCRSRRWMLLPVDPGHQTFYWGSSIRNKLTPSVQLTLPRAKATSAIDGLPTLSCQREPTRT